EAREAFPSGSPPGALRAGEPSCPRIPPVDRYARVLSAHDVRPDSVGSDAGTYPPRAARVPSGVTAAPVLALTARRRRLGGPRSRLAAGSRWLAPDRNPLGTAHAGRLVRPPRGTCPGVAPLIGADSPHRGRELRHIPLPDHRVVCGVPRAALS